MEAKGMGGRGTQSHHLGPAGDWDAGQGRKWGGSERADGGDRQRYYRNPGQDNPDTNRELIFQAKDGKGGENGRGKAYTRSREELLGLPRRVGKRRREVEAGRQGCRPGGQSLRAREVWEVISG